MLRKLIVLTVLAAAAVVTFFVFHHPPMRLMPAPLIFRDDAADALDVGPALAIDTRVPLFYATSRFPAGPTDNRVYTVVPDTRLHLGQATMRIGEPGFSLDSLREWSTGNAEGDRPFIYLERMSEYATLSAGEPPDEGAAAWFAAINDELARARSHDILVYVHGANTTVERAAGQAAQLSHFAGRNAVVVLFAWPTAENFLRYLRDVGTAFGAAPHLADLIGLLAEHTDAKRIGVFTYSAGATVGSDALARLGRERPDVAARLGEVYHAAPDADFRGFVDDLGAYGKSAARVTTAVNLGDSALRLSGAMNRGSRAGRPDLRELSPEASEWLLGAARDEGLEIVQVQPETMPDLPATSHTFWYDDPWVSSDVLVTLLFHLPPADRGLEEGEAASGTRYWTFPADYPERIPSLRAALHALVRGSQS